MPKKMNTNKAAAAVYQNAKAIEDAKRTGGLFGAVTRALGNRGFEVQLRVAAKGESTHGVLVQATPRTLFQGGKKAPVRIAVGHVVLLAGELKAKDCGVQRPLEIVARLDSKDEIRELIKLGLMSSAVLGIAETAGAVTAAAEAVAEDLFDSDDSDGDFWSAGLKDVKGGLKAQRQAAEAVATITARVATLKSQKGRKGIDGGVEAGDLADPALFSDPDYERFQRWRAHKATARAMAGGGSSAAAAPVVAVAQPEAVQTMAELMQQFKLEKEAALHAADQAAIVAAAEAGQRAAEVKAWAAKQGAKANWDDEDDEVRMEDL
jgi:hypothetical protein